MTRRPILVALLASLLVAPALRAEAPPAATPESVGLSSERLQRLRAVMQQFVDEGRVSGIVTYVARNGRVAHLEAFGKADVEAGRPMQKDTIFRIASQTKALTSVAADDARRGGEDRPRRPRVEVHPRLREDDGRGPTAARGRGGLARRGRAREAADHDPRPADPHRRHLLRLRPRAGPVEGGGHPGLVLRRPQRAGVGRRRAHGRPPHGRAAGREVRLRLQHRHPRRGGREGLGSDPGGVLPEADHGAARPRGHAVLPARRPRRTAWLPSTRQRTGRSRGPPTRSSARATTSTARAWPSPAARDFSPPRATTAASSRCC